MSIQAQVETLKPASATVKAGTERCGQARHDIRALRSADQSVSLASPGSANRIAVLSSSPAFAISLAFQKIVKW
jgi:hypothetical protein